MDLFGNRFQTFEYSLLFSNDLYFPKTLTTWPKNPFKHCLKFMKHTQRTRSVHHALRLGMGGTETGYGFHRSWPAEREAPYAFKRNFPRQAWFKEKFSTPYDNMCLCNPCDVRCRPCWFSPNWHEVLKLCLGCPLAVSQGRCYSKVRCCSTGDFWGRSVKPLARQRPY